MEHRNPDGTDDLSLDADLERRIREFASESGEPPVEVVRRAFDEYAAANPRNREAKRSESIFDRWSRLGFLHPDDSSGLPVDLSTNKKHMDGFGRD